MWFWQRKEVWAGTSLEEFSRVRNLLAERKIKYDTTVKDRMKLDPNGRINGMARMGGDPALNTMYYLYVDRVDYDFAVSVLNGSSDD